MRDGGFEQALRQLIFPVPTVEAINELIGVLLQMLPGGAVESSQHEAFEIGDDQMDLRQPLVSLLGPRDLWLMEVTLAETCQRRQRTLSRTEWSTA